MMTKTMREKGQQTHKDDSTRPLVKAKSTEKENVYKALQYYRNTIRLLKQQGQPDDMFQISLKHIRYEYKQSGYLTGQDAIDV
jgi:hypothetical protein